MNSPGLGSCLERPFAMSADARAAQAPPSVTRRGSRSAPGREKGGASYARNRATGVHAGRSACHGCSAPLRAPRILRRPPDSVERARFSNAAPEQQALERPGPVGKRAWTSGDVPPPSRPRRAMLLGAAGLDIRSVT